MNWEIYKRATEYKYKFIALDQSDNYQIQPHAKLGKGLSLKEIKDLEALFGFKFPLAYKSILRAFNGLETLEISKDPAGMEPDDRRRFIYKYPDDYENVLFRIEENHAHLKYIKACLAKHRITTIGIEGFIPLYSNRHIVVYKDKSLSPVISVHQGDDVVYWKPTVTRYLRSIWGNYARYSRVMKDQIEKGQRIPLLSKALMMGKF